VPKERLSRERAGRNDDRTMADVEAAIRLSLALKSVDA
jgi:hypothetical protein